MYLVTPASVPHETFCQMVIDAMSWILAAQMVFFALFSIFRLGLQLERLFWLVWLNRKACESEHGYCAGAHHLNFLPMVF
jgi:hypothetical protein